LYRTGIRYGRLTGVKKSLEIRRNIGHRILALFFELQLG
jgi:hypothetical protein